ncbi:hypothetical protein KQI33_11800 [Enterococcus devriesei]|uniref:hypothetical protein n=1 Tax=Enterococcus devriesei TaxID=319970 RepID=UPI001C0FCF4E|nr:hypothetical protein [Enterococcus devriesei]MBU5366059.1 hypothetical protein [Enterococcus devriesei]
MGKLIPSTCLDDQHWSLQWEHYLKRAAPFNPASLLEITCIVPIPNQPGVLIFTAEKIYHCEDNGLTVLRQFSAAHCFPHYQLICTSLKPLNCFRSYKTPWLCPYFALFPLEDIRRTMWINPLKIAKLHKQHDRYYAELIAGPLLALPILRRSFLLHAEFACYGLALMRRELFHFSIKGASPLDYLPLPDTYFSRLLSKRPRLAFFSQRLGEFSRRYNKAYFLHHYQQLEKEPHEMDWPLW